MKGTAYQSSFVLALNKLVVYRVLGRQDVVKKLMGLVVKEEGEKLMLLILHNRLVC